MPRLYLVSLIVFLTLAAAAPASAKCTLWMQFGFGSAAIRPAAQGLLDRVAALYPGSAYSVVGHADAPGSEFTNLRMSRQRAEGVAAYLGRRGVGGVVSVEARAQSELLMADHGPEKVNRRVLVYVSPCSDAALTGS